MFFLSSRRGVISFSCSWKRREFLGLNFFFQYLYPLFYLLRKWEGLDVEPKQAVDGIGRF